MQHPLDTYITKSVFDVLLFKVGPTWGRKMVKGYMASGGITAGDKRVGRALSVVSPLYQAQRNSNTARQTNPFPYHADYFGHKLHMDQNEKLAMYGLTEVRGPWVIRPFNFQSKLKIENRCQFLFFLSFFSLEINKRVSRNISSFSRV